ncbi:hypothetical protein BJ684DRAFT_15478 [Piptocephalis cylindrospora]|uniref:Uncharacterized protein n=1 Tax=Piptocephalis cylindrospora TaxID=1907219 RepID=A0A4P9Y5G0_9FUNG|nr:hypothetical protein BJ684DRAFT_15478 [Piptocephalis cylindrospora]|eukprot:RKP14185.1 hypothetical protein BJ684DRAFT_15478 [Piptocephalis cylindrospora]
MHISLAHLMTLVAVALAATVGIEASPDYHEPARIPSSGSGGRSSNSDSRSTPQDYGNDAESSLSLRNRRSPAPEPPSSRRRRRRRPSPRSLSPQRRRLSDSRSSSPHRRDEHSRAQIERNAIEAIESVLIIERQLMNLGSGHRNDESTRLESYQDIQLSREVIAALGSFNALDSHTRRLVDNWSRMGGGMFQEEYEHIHASGNSVDDVRSSPLLRLRGYLFDWLGETPRSMRERVTGFEEAVHDFQEALNSSLPHAHRGPASHEDMRDASPPPR